MEEEIAKLRRELAEARAAKALSDARAEHAEAERQRADAERQRADAERQRAEAEREQEHRRRIQNERDMAAVIAAMEQERAAEARRGSKQQLDGYLAAVNSLNYVIPRLIPPPRTAVKTLSEGVKAKSTTSGRTTVTKKYYPLKMRAWPEFPQECRNAFARIYALIGEAALFPSMNDMKYAQTRLLEDFPTLFLGSESFINEMKTSHFLHESLQIPVQKILNAYLNESGQEQQLFFDNQSTGWMTRSRHDGDAVNTDDEAGDLTTAAKALSMAEVPRKTQPDCLVLCAHVATVSDEDRTAKIKHVYRTTLGEHKAVHRLRAPTVAHFFEKPLPEDFMLQLARRARSSKPTANQTNPNPDANLEALAAEMRCLPGQVYYARAICQTFHYMVTSGMEYGYLASGETLTLLRVAPADPTTLLYCTTLFPQYVGGESDEGNAELDRNDLAATSLAGLCLLAFESSTEPLRQRTLNLSQLALFPELPPSEEERTSAATTRSSTPQSESDGSRGRRRRRDDDDNDGDSGNGDDDSGSGGNGDGRRSYLTVPDHRPRKPSPLKRQRTASSNEENDSGSLPFKRHRVDFLQNSRRSLTPSLPTPLDPSSFRPIRPYCSQACLRGLVFGEAMDHSCPNAVLHLQAFDSHGDTRHAVTHAIGLVELHELVQKQLLCNIEQDCECLLSQGQWGAIGCLFKITVTGYGYTFVAKGVQSFDYALLRHEVRVYDRLSDQQGFLIPVCLGIMRLLQPYPMDNCMLVTHMMLMSYAGQPLYSPQLRSQPALQTVDLESEARRTVRELFIAGLVDDDDESEANLTWCAERGRVMRIDFDQAEVHPRPRHDSDENKSPWQRPNEAAHGRSQDDSGVWLPCQKYSGHSAVESLLLV